MDKIISNYLKSLPWHIMIISLSVATAVFILAIHLCKLGGPWIILGVILAIPSFYTIIEWAKRILSVINTAKQFQAWGDNAKTKTQSTNNNSTSPKFPPILYFKNNEAALAYAREYMIYDPASCVGIIRSVGVKNSPILNLFNFFVVSVADGKNSDFTYVAHQHPSLEKNLQVGDFVVTAAITDQAYIKKYYGDCDDIVLIITGKLQPAYSIEESGWLKER